MDAVEGVTTTTGGRQRVVIVGGGFGGLYAARALKDDRVEVTLIDRQNHHVFSPLLYQVATAQLAPGEIAQPLRALLRGQSNTQVLLGEAVDLDPVARSVRLSDGAAVAYDSLIVATGTRHSWFGHDDWEPLAPGLKTIDDALGIRRRILLAFEQAERESDPATRAAWMTFVVVGGGPTGVELAGALGEVARDALRQRVPSHRSHDGAHRAGGGARPGAAHLSTGLVAPGRGRSGHIGRDREDRHAGHGDHGRRRRHGDRRGGRAPRHADRAVGRRRPGRPRSGAPWPTALDAATDRAGRIIVQPDLTVPGHPEVTIVGDLALTPWQPGRAVPGVAQGAIQGGRYAGRRIIASLDGRTTPPFRYKDLGELATIGRLRAVADFRRFRLTGLVAWMLWLSIHIVWLIGLQNRLLVLVRWAWSFITRGRSNRLITGPVGTSAADDDPT